MTTTSPASNAPRPGRSVKSPTSIASLSGRYQSRNAESIVLDVGGVGYLVYLPPVVWDALGDLQPDQPLHFKIVYQASAQQPRPTLFGFLSEAEKEFFELLAGIPRLGGRNAAKAMVLPVNVLAQAIQEGNRELLDRLPGVSSSGAEKIIASLRKKVAPFVALGAGNGAHGRSFFVSFELGVAFTGQPKVTLSASRSTPGLAADLELEALEVEDDIKWLKFYPIVSLGIGIRF